MLSTMEKKKIKLIPKIYNGYVNPTSIEAATSKLALQLADPTGVSSYPDVAEAIVQLSANPTTSNLKNLIIETIGALPMFGKVSAPYKAAKTAKLISRLGEIPKIEKLANRAESVNKVIDTFPELIPITKKLTEKTQNITTKYITDPVFFNYASMNKLNRVNDYRKTNSLINLLNASNSLEDLISGTKDIVNNIK